MTKGHDQGRTKAAEKEGRLLTRLLPLLFILITNCVVSGMVFSTTEVCLLTCAAVECREVDSRVLISQTVFRFGSQ